MTTELANNEEKPAKSKRVAPMTPDSPAPPSDLMTIVSRLASDPTADIAKLGQLLEMVERREANDARKAFVVALGDFKAHAPKILKNKDVKFGQTEFSHATLDHVSSAIGAELTKHGLSHRWSVSQVGGLVSVTCSLTHVLGHSESVTMQAEPDKSGSKNSIQAIGSTVTYLQRYTLLAATGCAVGGTDTDGKIKDPDKQMDDMELEAAIGDIALVGTVVDLQKTYTKHYKSAQELGDKSAMARLIAAKDARKAELMSKAGAS